MAELGLLLQSAAQVSLVFNGLSSHCFYFFISFSEDPASMRVVLLGELMAGADFKRDHLYVE